MAIPGAGQVPVLGVEVRPGEAGSAGAWAKDQLLYGTAAYDYARTTQNQVEILLGLSL